MNYFKIDIDNIKNSVEKYRLEKKKYEENLMMVYNSFENIDSAWNDNNSLLFINRVNSDKNTILNYLNSLDKLFDDLLYFVKGLELALRKVNYNGSPKKLKFDNNKYIDIKKKFNSVLYYLDDAMKIINGSFVSSNFNDMNLINNLSEQLTDTISLVKLLMNNVDKFVKSILNEINSLITKIEKNENLNINLDIIEYKSVIVDILN